MNTTVNTTVTRTAASHMDALAQLLHSTATDTHQLGVLGEQYAALWLELHGCRILDRNWRTRFGELDIVAFTTDGLIAFVEVKTRRSLRCGLPQESVDSRKQTSLRRAGVQWLLDPEHRVAHRGVRFDVISVTVQQQSKPVLHHIPGAF